MPSTAIRSYEYDPEQMQLWITFVRGKTYVYERVPQHVYDHFKAYTAKGNFFNRFIRERYRFREVKLAS